MAIAASLPRQRSGSSGSPTGSRRRRRLLPAILRHGDLWTGNLLVDRGRLTGFVDWDAAHPAGVAGSDLLQLVAVDLRARPPPARPAYLARPWDSTEFRSAAAEYWPAAGIEPTARAIELAGLGWWAAEVNGDPRPPPEPRGRRALAGGERRPVLTSLGV